MSWFLKKEADRFIFFLPALFACLLALSGETQCTQNTGNVSVNSLGSVVILHQGRKQPFETYANFMLTRFSGRKRIDDMNPVDWLAQLLFDPYKAGESKVFLINNPEIAHAIGIDPSSGRRYSFNELSFGFKKLFELSENAGNVDSDQRSSFQTEILKTKYNLEEYIALMSAFSFLEPHHTFRIHDSLLAKRLGFTTEMPLSYIELIKKSHKISERMGKVKFGSLDTFSSEDAELVSLARKMFEFGSSIGNPSPHIIPGFDSISNDEEWVSPWRYLDKYHTASLQHAPMKTLISMREAYLSRDQAGFDRSVNRFRESVSEICTKKISLPNTFYEIIYNRLSPFSNAKLLYGISAVFALLTVLAGRKVFYRSAMLITFLAFVLHTTGMVLRVIIMLRPPATNLYETYVFVAWSSVLLGIILEILRQKPIGVLTSALTGFLFLHIAGGYALESDTMGMLAAVLNSNFWLTTHIITIALGYAGLTGSSLVAHFYFGAELLGRTDSRLREMERSLWGLFAFGFIFTFLGTVFGGMWADQAWGRFWGWDPKENGALVIILWCLVVFHARSAKMIRQRGTAVGAIVSGVLVMLTWVGVNLLGVGLHAYGFTSSGGYALLVFLAIETVFLGCVAVNGRLRRVQILKNREQEV